MYCPIYSPRLFRVGSLVYIPLSIYSPGGLVVCLSVLRFFPTNMIFTTEVGGGAQTNNYNNKEREGMKR